MLENKLSIQIWFSSLYEYIILFWQLIITLFLHEFLLQPSQKEITKNFQEGNWSMYIYIKAIIHCSILLFSRKFYSKNKENLTYFKPYWVKCVVQFKRRNLKVNIDNFNKFWTVFYKLKIGNIILHTLDCTRYR